MSRDYTSPPSIARCGGYAERDCDITRKVANAQAAGAIGVVVAQRNDTTAHLLSSSSPYVASDVEKNPPLGNDAVVDATRFTIPVIGVTAADGERISQSVADAGVLGEETEVTLRAPSNFAHSSSALRVTGGSVRASFGSVGVPSAVAKWVSSNFSSVQDAEVALATFSNVSGAANCDELALTNKAALVGKVAILQIPRSSAARCGTDTWLRLLLDEGEQIGVLGLIVEQPPEDAVGSSAVLRPLRCSAESGCFDGTVTNCSSHSCAEYRCAERFCQSEGCCRSADDAAACPLQAADAAACAMLPNGEAEGSCLHAVHSEDAGARLWRNASDSSDGGAWISASDSGAGAMSLSSNAGSDLLYSLVPGSDGDNACQVALPCTSYACAQYACSEYFCKGEGCDAAAGMIHGMDGLTGLPKFSGGCKRDLGGEPCGEPGARTYYRGRAVHPGTAVSDGRCFPDSFEEDSGLACLLHGCDEFACVQRACATHDCLRPICRQPGTNGSFSDYEDCDAFYTPGEAPSAEALLASPPPDAARPWCAELDLNDERALNSAGRSWSLRAAGDNTFRC